MLPEFHMVSGGGTAGVHPKAHRQKRQSPVRVQQCGAQERGSCVSYKLLKGQTLRFYILHFYFFKCTLSELSSGGFAYIQCWYLWKYVDLCVKIIDHRGF